MKHFIEIKIKPDAEMRENVLLNKVYTKFHKRLFDQNGYPGSKPPWGTVTAIDLNTGKIIWQTPFGEYEQLKKKGIPITGQTNMGGVTGTAGNLIFATGTLDKKIRAFDSRNGKEIWNYQLPFSGSSPPTIYEYNNEQFILVVSTGSSSLYNFPYPTKDLTIRGLCFLHLSNKSLLNNKFSLISWSSILTFPISSWFKAE